MQVTLQRLLQRLLLRLLLLLLRCWWWRWWRWSWCWRRCSCCWRWGWGCSTTAAAPLCSPSEALSLPWASFLQRCHASCPSRVLVPLSWDVRADWSLCTGLLLPASAFLQALTTSVAVYYGLEAFNLRSKEPLPEERPPGMLPPPQGACRLFPLPSCTP